MCENGFTSYDNDPSQGCFDVDECSSQTNVCHPDAECSNEPGGYSCRCLPGFIGNGQSCEAISTEGTEPDDAWESTTPNIPSLAPEHWLCDQCSPYADCNQGICQCRGGWHGDGVQCVRICPEGYDAVDAECIPLSDEDDEGMYPFCQKLNT